jgi:hypothetical protein
MIGRRALWQIASREVGMSTLTRRDVVGIGAAAGVVALSVSQVAAQSRAGRRVTIDARPAAITLDTSTTAVIVVDMQNDFGSKGGMFERAGIDISGIQKAVAPTARVLDAARKAGLKVIYRNGLARSNHEASLLSTETLLGWVSDSNQFSKALHA